jgi:hypothetical protein
VKARSPAIECCMANERIGSAAGCLHDSAASATTAGFFCLPPLLVQCSVLRKQEETWGLLSKLGLAMQLTVTMVPACHEGYACTVSASLPPVFTQPQQACRWHARRT